MSSDIKIGSGVLAILVVLASSAQAAGGPTRFAGPQQGPHSVNLRLGATPTAGPAAMNATISGLPGALPPSELPAAVGQARPEQTGVQQLDRALETGGQLTQSIAESAERGGDLGALRTSGQDLADMKLSGPSAVSASDEDAELAALQREITAVQPMLNAYRSEVGKVIFGQPVLLDLVLGAMLTQNGHSMLIGIPGLAKTLLAETLSKVIKIGYQKIQYTADLLPSDIIGSADRTKDGARFIRKGPIFGGRMQLWDEINRAGPKVKSAVLEAMQQGKVTIEGVQHRPDLEGDLHFPGPLKIIATMNPKSTAGVFPLDEAEVDRYLVSIDLERPDRESRRRISQEQGQTKKYEPKQVMTEADLDRITLLAEKVRVSKEMEDYYLDIVAATQPDNRDNKFPLNGMVDLGASPRADIGMRTMARVHALMNNRAYVNADDVQYAARYVLRHRIFMSYKAKSKNKTADDLIEEIIAFVKPPLPPQTAR